MHTEESENLDNNVSKAEGEKQRNYAIIATILGILSITLGICIAIFGYFTAIPGLVLSHKAKNMPGEYQSLANIASILCWVGLAITIINSIGGVIYNLS
jgi:flagellar biosynthesis component FlhA